MKFIISHDVDHLYTKEHWTRDLFVPKLIVRSFMQAVKHDISLKECVLRIKSCFHNQMHRINDVMQFDSMHNVPSTFFFGMNQGLGMSYRPEEAKGVIVDVYNNGFDVGVHGIEFQDESGIRKEYNTFIKTTGITPSGIRMHYVRYSSATFAIEEKQGYLFDSSEFDKGHNGSIKKPYRIGSLWEFPLAIMDSYLPINLEEAKTATINRIDESRRAGINYITVLFHEYQFDKAYSNQKAWYIWLIEMIEQSKTDSFISFTDAISEMEAKNERDKDNSLR